MRRPTSPLAAASAQYFEGLEALFRKDPNALDPGWRAVFQLLDEVSSLDRTESAASPTPNGNDEALAAAYRRYGHRLADLDPLGLMDAAWRGPNGMKPVAHASSSALLALEGSVNSSPQKAEALHRIYAGTLAIETAHIDDAWLRSWLVEAFENGAQLPPASARRAALGQLVAAEEFDKFFSLKWPTKKRFGSEGADALAPLLHRLVEKAAKVGITHIVVGPMHRGRLNLMTNVFGEPLADLIAKFKGAHPFPGANGIAADVPYHLGLEGKVATMSGEISIIVLPNPSHLEAVNPVVLGRVRALQHEARGKADAGRILGIILHTDASVIAQGSIAEMIQLSGLEGYTTGGTLHVIVNNQIGFTTEPHEARTSLYCTGAFKAIDSAILHANGNDADAVIRAADLAMEFRARHRRDAVIDLICYRKNGHNEIDEPRFTQPLLYRTIEMVPPVRALYQDKLIDAGVVTPDEVENLAASHRAKLEEAYAAAADHRPNGGGFPGGKWALHDPARGTDQEPATGVPETRLIELLEKLAAVPEDFSVDRKVARLMRAQTASTGALRWATAESLAFASLLIEGVRVRLSGQDIVRGAFSHRHLALFDSKTGTRHVPLAHLSTEQASFEAINSPLSEYAVLGFEYGVSLERPDALTIWEAQFGDFGNGAQIIIDQFIVSGEEKWMQPSGLVLLLPHGLEGQGPEHSSARPERILQLAAKDNIELANPSTPANYFHLLRRQVLRQRRKPLFVTSPKTLLRLPEAVSPLSDFREGKNFEPVLASLPRGEVRRVILCTGKLAYELEKHRQASQIEDAAVLRIERLYPLPESELAALFRKWRHAHFVFAQEEPENQGWWAYLDRPLERLLREAGTTTLRFACVARPASPSPAGSFHGDHEKDQQALVRRAFG
ncbi:MAG: 2-oxoglutarate dehydrogenase E1 component [Hyphomicrobiales bacterium]|nr:2-oxoglutarate dehydrogenase E1 component [Hyphomicrobiales bacterium]